MVARGPQDTGPVLARRAGIVREPIALIVRPAQLAAAAQGARWSDPLKVVQIC